MNRILRWFSWLFPRLKESPEKPNYAFYATIILSGFGLASICVYSFTSSSELVLGTNTLSKLLLIALCAFAVGAMVGFIFGIPKMLQTTENSTQSPTNSSVQQIPNTNLEQISDWLTKIIVGVGLTQINSIAIRFNNLITQLDDMFYEGSGGHISLFIGTIIVHFFIVGFLMSYLWTRLFLGQIQASNIDEKIASKLQDNDTNNKQATSLAYNQLNLPVGAKDFEVDDLYDAFKKASGNLISTLFFRAMNVRKMNWRNDKQRMERAIPIFKALIRLDENIEFPENFAELGFALKDKTDPDFIGSIKNLTKAIDGFRTKGDLVYLSIALFNRAFCKIKLDSDFGKKTPSVASVVTDIKSDLVEAYKTSFVMKIINDDPDVQSWLHINNVQL